MITEDALLAPSTEILVSPSRKLNPAPLFAPTPRALWQQDAYRMIQRRTRGTAHLKNKGTLEAAQHIANHESPRTTKLYDRRQDEIALDEVERIAI